MPLEEDEDDDDQDAEWTQEAKELPGQNRQDLPNFSRMSDRFGVSDRAGAALFNAAMIDCNIIKKGECKGLLEKSKLRRQREKWGDWRQRNARYGSRKVSSRDFTTMEDRTKLWKE